MTTICMGMVFLLSDFDVVEKREVSLTVLPRSTLQVSGIVMLSITLARGRRWMSLGRIVCRISPWSGTLGQIGTIDLYDKLLNGVDNIAQCRSQIILEA